MHQHRAPSRPPGLSMHQHRAPSRPLGLSMHQHRAPSRPPGPSMHQHRSVNKEIEEGEREMAGGLSKAPRPAGASPKSAPRAPRRNERDIRKEMTNLERSIAKLYQQKREIHGQLMETTVPAEALRLHDEFTTLSSQLAEAEEKWLRLQEELTDAD